MAQISRPFQIAAAAVVLLLGVWLFAIHGHSNSSSSEPAAPASSPTPSAAAQEKKAAAPTPVYHGSAPGVSGLTRAIAKAHGAVATSQHEARQLEQRSAAASDEPERTASAPASHPTALSPATSTSHPTSVAASAPAHSAAKLTPATKAAPKSAATRTSGVPANQALVEGELKQGKVVIVLFWNRHGSDDVLVHRELQLLVRVHHVAAKAKAEEVRHTDRFFGLELDKKIAVHESPASAVATYGSVTRGVQVYGTPSIVIVGPSHKAEVITGFTDAYSIEQAIEEARSS